MLEIYFKNNLKLFLYLKLNTHNLFFLNPKEICKKRTTLNYKYFCKFLSSK